MKDTLPDNPADARDMNRGRDVLKTTAHPFQELTLEAWGAMEARLESETVAFKECIRQFDLQAATIAALRGALEKIHANAAESPEWIRRVVDSALASCPARDGKAGGK